MGVFTDIQKALEVKLASISGAPAIVWENTKYTPSMGTKYWRPTLLPAASQLASVDALQKHQGIYQVDIFVTPEKGPKLLIDELDKIYAAFNTTLSLTSGSTRVDILGVGRGSGRNEGAWYTGFIGMYYMC